jgi:hypothetical protein
MREKMDAVRLLVEVDVDSYVRAGIADFQGQPHLFLSECLDWDDERRSRRLGETFFLVPVPAAAADAFLPEAAELDVPVEDPEWKTKQARRWALWVAFKGSAVGPAEGAWRARGNFRAVQRSRNRSVHFRWVLLPGGRVSGEALRARLARLEELKLVLFGSDPEASEGEDIPF